MTVIIDGSRADDVGAARRGADVLAIIVAVAVADASKEYPKSVRVPSKCQTLSTRQRHRDPHETARRSARGYRARNPVRAPIDPSTTGTPRPSCGSPTPSGACWWMRALVPAIRPLYAPPLKPCCSVPVTALAIWFILALRPPTSPHPSLVCIDNLIRYIQISHVKGG